MVIHAVLALALMETLALSAALLVWARQVEGARLLAAFLLGVGTWIVGNELPNWAGIASAPWALALLATVPLTSAAFLHFCALFTGWRPSRGLLAAAYGAAAAAVAISLYRSPGTFVHFPAFTGVQWVVVPNRIGWTTSLVWAGLAAGGLLLLARAFWRSTSAAHRRQIAAVALSCGWGLMCISGYGFAALGIAQYPWQVLAFPAYPVILVYGILRYRVFVANAWARKALAWALLTGLGLLAVPLSLLLPLESRWVTAAVVAAVCLSLGGPVRRRAGRGSSRNTAGNTTSITGTLMRNAAPHQKCSSSAPPTSGPTAAPAAPTVPQRPSAIARSRSSSNVRRMMPSTHGMIIEPPSASSTRAAISSAGLGANAASRDARPKTARPASSSRRWPVRSASVPMGTSRPAMSSG